MADPGADTAARAEALDATRSFIVQAPAGSGKTELLIQRVLRLLAEVEQPEEVVAITFTRKAAAEMRHRLLDALVRAGGPQPEGEPGRTTWRLASDVLEKDGRLGWGLTETPARLRVQTIDSLCAAITRRWPWRSGFGGAPAPGEQMGPYHEEAARAALAKLEEKGEAGDAVARLLSHLDNNLGAAADLLRAMLGRRDQWLRHVTAAGGTLRRQDAEALLGRIVREGLEAARTSMPES